MKKTVAKLKEAGLVQTLKYTVHRISEKYHEKKLGIDSAGYISLRDLGLGEHDQTCGSYEPISYSSIIAALNQIETKSDCDVFIDYGSGKGRAVLVAATYPFKKVIGVELSEELNHVAKANAESGRSRFNCKNIEFITANAVYFQPPDDISVILLNNPFSHEMLNTVVENILTSLKRSPRKITIIYKYPNWASDPFYSDPRFSMTFEYVGYSDTGEILRNYEIS